MGECRLVIYPSWIVQLTSYTHQDHHSREGTIHMGLDPSHRSLIKKIPERLLLSNLMEAFSQLMFLFPEEPLGEFKGAAVMGKPIPA